MDNLITRVNYYLNTKEDVDSYKIKELFEILESGLIHLFPSYVAEYMFEVLNDKFRHEVGLYKEIKARGGKYRESIGYSGAVMIEDSFIPYHYNENYPIERIDKEYIKETIEIYMEKTVEDYYVNDLIELMKNTDFPIKEYGKENTEYLSNKWFIHTGVKINSLAVWMLGTEESSKIGDRYYELFVEKGKKKIGEEFYLEDEVLEEWESFRDAMGKQIPELKEEIYWALEQ